MRTERFKLANKPGSADLVIPEVRTIEFAQDLVGSVSDAFDKFMPESKVFWTEENVLTGKGSFKMTIPIRLCVACGQPILRGRAWTLMYDRNGLLKWIDVAKHERDEIMDTIVDCCERGQRYNDIRDAYFISQLKAIKDSFIAFRATERLSKERERNENNEQKDKTIRFKR